MTYVSISPEIVASAAADIESIGETLARVHTAVAGPTTSVVSAAADEVSTAIAALFSQHAVDYRVLAAQAATFHEQLTRTLVVSGNSTPQPKRPPRHPWRPLNRACSE